MQQNLWGELEDCIPLQRRPSKTSLSASTFIHIDGICTMQGHSWEYFGITGLKVCSVCGIKGFCPGCTPQPPVKEAKPFFCTEHTPPESGV